MPRPLPQSTAAWIRAAEWPLYLAMAAAGVVMGALVVRDLRLALLVMAGIVAVAGILRFPRAALISAVMLVLVEGALRKWVFPSVQEFLYFAKDGVLLVLLAWWLIRVPRKQGEIRPFGAGTMLLFAGLGGYLFLQIFNPHNPSLGMYLFGIRNYMLPMLFLLLVPTLLPPATFERVLRMVVWALLPMTLLALLQSQLPPDHVLNAYVHNADTQVAVFGDGDEGRVRATSVFSYISGFTTFTEFAMVAAPFAIGVATRSMRIGLGALLVCGVFATIFSGSRAPLVFALLAIPITTYPLWRDSVPRTAVRVLAAAGIAIFLAHTAFEEPVADYRTRWESADDTTRRFKGLIASPRKAIENGGLFGYGPGTAHQSRERLLSKLGDWGTLPPKVENELSRTIHEIGAIGALLWLGFRIALILSAYGWYIRTPRSAIRRRMGLLGVAAMGALTLPTAFLSVPARNYLWFFWLAGMRFSGIGPDAESDSENASKRGTQSSKS